MTHSIATISMITVEIEDVLPSRDWESFHKQDPENIEGLVLGLVRGACYLTMIWDDIDEPVFVTIHKSKIKDWTDLTTEEALTHDKRAVRHRAANPSW